MFIWDHLLRISSNPRVYSRLFTQVIHGLVVFQWHAWGKTLGSRSDFWQKFSFNALLYLPSRLLSLFLAKRNIGGIQLFIHCIISECWRNVWGWVQLIQLQQHLSTAFEVCFWLSQICEFVETNVAFTSHHVRLKSAGQGWVSKQN